MAASTLPKRADHIDPYCRDQGIPYLVAAAANGMGLQYLHVTMPSDGQIVFADEGLQDMADGNYGLWPHNHTAGAAVVNTVSPETYAIGNGETLTWKVDRGAEQTATFAATAAIITAANAGTYALDDGDTLDIEIDNDGGTTVTYNAGPATTTGTEVEPFAFTDGLTLVLNVNGGGDDTATFNCAAASVTGSNTETFALTDGWTLTLEIEGGAEQEFTFLTGSFVDIGAATAAEVCAVINATILGGISAPDTGAVKITSLLVGSSSQVQVTGGTARTALGLDVTLHEGAGDFADAANATAAEVIAVLTTDIANATATAVGGAIKVATDLLGTDASLVVGAGSTALTALGITADTYAGTGNVGDSTAVTAQEVIDAITAAVTGMTADLNAGKPRVTTTRLGTGAQVQVTSTGAIAAAVGFSATEQVGAGDAVDSAAVTAAEVVTWLVGDITGITFAVDESDGVLARSDTLGTGSYVQCTGGTANGAVDFDTDEHRGTGDVAQIGASVRGAKGFTITGPDTGDVLDILIVGRLKGQLG